MSMKKKKPPQDDQFQKVVKVFLTTKPKPKPKKKSPKK
jgi:hypothetical protein